MFNLAQGDMSLEWTTKVSSDSPCLWIFVWLIKRDVFGCGFQQASCWILAISVTCSMLYIRASEIGRAVAKPARPNSFFDLALTGCTSSKSEARHCKGGAE